MTISMRRAAPLFAAATATAILGIGVATASSASAEPSGSGSGSVFGGSAGGVQTPFGGGNFGSNTSGGVQIPGLQHPFGGGSVAGGSSTSGGVQTRLAGETSDRAPRAALEWGIPAIVETVERILCSPGDRYLGKPDRTVRIDDRPRVVEPAGGHRCGRLQPTHRRRSNIAMQF